MKNLLLVALILLLLIGGLGFVKAHLSSDDDSSGSVYRPSRIVVERTVGEETESFNYVMLSDALSKAEDGDVIRLLSDVDLGTLTEALTVDKCVTIDGSAPDGGRYKIAANGSVDMFDLNGGDLTLKNVSIDYVSTGDDHAMINADRTKGNLYVSNSVLFSKYRTLYFYERENEYEIVIDQNSVVMSTDARETIFFQSYKESDKHSTITIENALVAGASKYAIQLYNKKGSLHLKEGARVVTDGSAPEIAQLFNVHKSSVDYPIYVGGTSPTFVTILYGDAAILGWENRAIYHTSNASSNSKNVYYSEDYRSSDLLVQDDRRLYTCELQEALVTYPNGSVRVPCNVDVAEPLIIYGDASFVSSVADTNGDGVISESTITYLGTGNAFEIGSHAVTFTGVNIVANGNVAFSLGENASLVLGEGVNVTCAKILDGFDGTQTVIVVEADLAEALKGEDYALLFDSAVGYRVADYLTDQTALAGAYVEGTNFTDRYCTWDDMVESYELYLDSKTPYYAEDGGELCAPGDNVVVPDDVTYVAWFDANSIVLPKTTTSVGGAYEYCYTIYIKATTPPELLGDLQGMGMSEPPVIVVPIGCGEIYKAAEGWSVYADYIVEGKMPI